MYEIKRTEDEITHLMKWALDAIEKLETNYPGESYETGLLQSFEWLFGIRNDSPLDDL